MDRTATGDPTATANQSEFAAVGGAHRVGSSSRGLYGLIHIRVAGAQLCRYRTIGGVECALIVPRAASCVVC